MTTETLAVYGAAFDPPHAGHLDAMAQLLELVDKVLLVPAYRHAFGKQMSHFEQRLALLRAAIDASGLPPERLIIAPVERQIAAEKGNSTAVYSWDLLVYLQRQYPNAQLLLAIGPDNAAPAQWQTFHRYQDIDARWRKLVVAERVQIRSSVVRAAIAAGQSVDATLVPDPVLQLIAESGLYRS